MHSLGVGTGNSIEQLLVACEAIEKTREKW